MASSSSKNIDHGNYIPTPIAPGVKVADGEHIRKVFVLCETNGHRACQDAATNDGHRACRGVDDQVASMVGERCRTTSSATDGKSGRVANNVAAVVRPVAVVRQAHQPIEATDLAEIPENIEVGADASLDLTVIVLPGVSARIPLTINLTGVRSEVRLSGIYLCSGHDEVTFDITMRHRTGDCRSQQIFNGLATGEAKCGFFGKIVIAPEAQRTEAFQENHNILLSDSAKINTKPRLEIYADDVKCSHGATVGKLNEDEQFYMRSRGIPEDEAKALQMISFVAPVLDSIPEETTDASPSRSTVAEQVENAIRSLA